MVPSTEALWRHWKRSCWVIDMWRQANKNTLEVAPITNYGWNVINDVLTIDWESDENRTAVSERVLLLTKGCRCKTGCTTGRCGCRKKGQSCTEGCSCLHCSNLPTTSGQEKQTLQDTAEVEMEENREIVTEENEELQQFLRTLFECDLESGSESEAVSDSESISSDDDILSD